MNTRSIRNFLLAALLISAASIRGDSLRVYLMGNSLTDNIDHSGLIQLAEEGRHTQIHGSHRIPGAPISWLYDHPDHGFSHKPFGRWGQAFAEYQWDAVSVQPFLRPLETDLDYIGRLMDTAKVLSPDVRFYIYAQWPNEYNGDYAQIWLQDVSPWMYDNDGSFITPQRTKMYFETLIDTLRKARPDMKAPFMSPVGHVFYVLDQKIKAGMIPEHSSVWEFVTGTHVNNVGSYVAGLTYFATLYRQNPIGMPVVEPYRLNPSSSVDLPITETLARKIQESVWEVVATHPLTGVKSNDPVTIVSPIVENATAGNAYRFLFLPGFGQYPYRWEITSGELPVGLSLSGAGKITGTTEAVGKYEFIIRVTDENGEAAEKQFTLTVEEDISPVIATASDLPEAQKAAYYSFQMETSGGNGTITWEFADSAYPPGMVLSRSGLLTGSSGIQGSYSFKIRAYDSDATSPDTTAENFQLIVGPATQSFFTARLVSEDAAPERDGVLDDECWEAGTEVQKVIKGAQPNNVVNFDAVWEDKGSGDLHIAVAVEDDSITEGDRVIVYIDALNNREEIYNWDDRRISIKAVDGRNSDDESIGSTRRIGSKAERTETGYTVEIGIDWRNLGMDKTDKGNRVIGFDIANIDIDADDGDTTILVWQGTNRNDIDTREFGAMVLGTDETSGPLHDIHHHSPRVAPDFTTGGSETRIRFPYTSDWTVTLYRFDGRTLFAEKVHSDALSIRRLTTGGGMYLWRLESDKDIFMRKFFMR